MPTSGDGLQQELKRRTFTASLAGKLIFFWIINNEPLFKPSHVGYHLESLYATILYFSSNTTHTRFVRESEQTPHHPQIGTNRNQSGKGMVPVCCVCIAGKPFQADLEACGWYRCCLLDLGRALEG